MGNTEYQLSHLSEECAEVIKCCTKAQRFGLADINPKSGNPNWKDLHEELGDILNMIDVLVDIGAIPAIDHAARNRKKAKGRAMMEYARERGTLNE